MEIHSMMLVRNEASRSINKSNIFKQVVEQLCMISDTITIIDDNSTDNTVEFLYNFNFDEYICKEEIIENKERKWNCKEWEVRKQLWEATIKKADHNDWIICLDADELFDNDHIDYLNYLLCTLSPQIDAVGLRLHDMWDMKRYRHDEYWSAHIYPWPMIVRYDKNRDYIWNEANLHCGRFPMNAGKQMIVTQIPLKHYGWADPKDRQEKYDRYMRVDPQGQFGIMEQYKSILDENPNLVEFGRCCIE